MMISISINNFYLLTFLNILIAEFPFLFSKIHCEQKVSKLFNFHLQLRFSSSLHCEVENSPHLSNILNVCKQFVCQLLSRIFFFKKGNRKPKELNSMTLKVNSKMIPQRFPLLWCWKLIFRTDTTPQVLKKTCYSTTTMM